MVGLYSCRDPKTVDHSGGDFSEWIFPENTAYNAVDRQEMYGYTCRHYNGKLRGSKGYIHYAPRKRQEGDTCLNWMNGYYYMETKP